MFLASIFEGAYTNYFKTVNIFWGKEVFWAQSMDKKNKSKVQRFGSWKKNIFIRVFLPSLQHSAKVLSWETLSKFKLNLNICRNNQTIHSVSNNLWKILCNSRKLLGDSRSWKLSLHFGVRQNGYSAETFTLSNQPRFCYRPSSSPPRGVANRSNNPLVNVRIIWIPRPKRTCTVLKVFKFVRRTKHKTSEVG